MEVLSVTIVTIPLLAYRIVVQFPADVPIQIFQTAKSLFVIVGERLTVGVAGIVVTAILSARELDRLEYHQDAETTLGFGGIENGVNR
jgi:hypothetical protein